MKVDPTCKKCEKKCKQRHPAVVVSCSKFIPVVSVGLIRKLRVEAISS